MSTTKDPAPRTGGSCPRPCRARPAHSRSRAAAQGHGQSPQHGARPRMERANPLVPRIPRDDEESTILMLAAIWALETGRALPAAPPCQMSRDELIEFWADPALEQAYTPSGSGGPAAGRGRVRPEARR
ncbi:hypothetical protein [Actinomadura luteofluorescens]|uniref:hypothetical protein n=1 Tax=Actinomadura luteofluorescens TaxID=46163 RepID=UPI003D8CBDFB